MQHLKNWKFDLFALVTVIIGGALVWSFYINVTDPNYVPQFVRIWNSAMARDPWGIKYFVLCFIAMPLVNIGCFLFEIYAINALVAVVKDKAASIKEALSRFPRFATMAHN
jgi:hypothetical protein